MKKTLVAIILVITWTLTSADKCDIAQLVAKNVTSTSLQLKWAQHVDCKHIDYRYETRLLKIEPFTVHVKYWLGFSIKISD